MQSYDLKVQNIADNFKSFVVNFCRRQLGFAGLMLRSTDARNYSIDLR